MKKYVKSDAGSYSNGYYIPNGAESRSEMSQNVRDWYLDVFPNERNFINDIPDCSFADLYAALKNYSYADGNCSIGDDVIEDRIFRQLAQILDVPYGYLDKLCEDGFDYKRVQNVQKILHPND